MNIHDDFELLLSASAKKYYEKEAEKFLSIDPTGFEASRKVQKRFQKLLKRKKGHRTFWGKLQIAALICLICLALGFTACMCIPAVRTEIKKIVMEWYDGYVAVDFQKSDENTTQNQESVNSAPKEIENKAYATDLPHSYTTEVGIDSRSYYAVNFYDENGFVFCLSQSIIHANPTWSNSENQTVHEVTINQNSAVIFEDLKMPNFYSIIWQDEQYEYNLMGTFSSMDELIKVAEGIKLTK